MQLSIIVPVYNEAPTIEAIIRRIATVPFKKEILVVDDGSTDGTREILMNLQKDEGALPLRCFFHEKNKKKIFQCLILHCYKTLFWGFPNYRSILVDSPPYTF